jgi:hypothetical protein
MIRLTLVGITLYLIQYNTPYYMAMTPKRSKVMTNLMGGDNQLSADETSSYASSGMDLLGNIMGAVNADPNHQGEATGKAIGGGVGATAGMLLGGPMGAQIGGQLGGMAGGLIGGSSDKRRAIASATEAKRKETLGIDLTANVNAYGQFKEGGAVDLGGGEDPIGPIGFTKSYLNSVMFKKRMLASGATPKQYKEALDYGNKQLNANPNAGAVPVDSWIHGSQAFVDKQAIYLDKKQAKENGYDLYNSVLPHELSHNYRKLADGEEERFVESEKNPRTHEIYNRYKKSASGKAMSYSDYLGTADNQNHDFQPDEQHADINAMRWLMMKHGIYDARKEQMTPEHLKKALANPTLKDDFIIKRLREHFSDEDIIKLNNGIADQGSPNSTIMHAKEGGLVNGGPGDPGDSMKTPPKRQLTPAEMQQWNGFVDYVEKRGYKGHNDLNTRNKNLGASLFNDYKKEANASINYDIVPSVQAEMYKLQQNNVDFMKRRGTDISGVMDNVSKVDGWFGSKTSQFKFPDVTEQQYHNGQLIKQQDKGLLNSAGQTTGVPAKSTTMQSLVSPQPAATKVLGMKENKDGDFVVGRYEEGGAVYGDAPAATASVQQQQPQQRTINVERGELLADKEGNVLDRYMNPNRFSKHAETQFKEPQGNFVQADAAAIVVPAKLARRFENGDKLTRKSILRNLVDQQVQDPTINQPQGAEEQYGDGGYIDPKYAEYMKQKLGLNGSGVDDKTLDDVTVTKMHAHQPDLSIAPIGNPTLDNFHPIDITAPASNAADGKAPQSGGKLDLGMLGRRLEGKLPGLYQMVNAMQGDPNLRKEYNHGFDRARANFMQMDDSYNVDPELMAIDQSTALGMDAVNQNNTPSARAEASMMTAKADEAKGGVFNRAVNYRRGVRNSMLGELANLDVQQGASNQGEDLRYQQEKRMNAANDQNIVANVLSENYRNDAQYSNDMEKIKMINAMSKFEDINPLELSRFSDDPEAINYIYNQLQQSRPLKEVLADLQASRQVSDASTRRTSTPKKTK